MTQPIYQYGGTGPWLHMALANGFPPETYEPLLAPLTSKYSIVSYPPRGLWEPPPSTDTAPNWEVMADDILAALNAHGQRDVIGIGHSMGGVGTLIAAAKEPSRFRGIALFDPVILKPWIHQMARIARWLGLHKNAPLAKGALQRRAHFGSVDEAFAYFRPKRLFKDWDDEVLRLYAEGLMTPTDDGVTLAWTPRWEAHYYQTLEATTWSWLRKLPADLPLLVLRGSKSNTFFPPVVDKMRSITPHMTLRTIEGHGHLFPQSAPEETRTHLQEWLGTL